jgi:lysophospholipase L1-like esterase
MVSRFSLALFSIVLSFAMLEIIFRLFDIQHDVPKTGTWQDVLVPRQDRVPGVRYQFKPHSRFYTQYGSNPDGYFDEHNRLYFHMNNYGFRGKDVEMKKPDGTIRVIVLGDSFTMGDGVKLEDTFCVLLEERLRKENRRVEVLNFGMSGWNTSDQVAYLREIGVRFNPDIVIVAYVLNDAAIELLPGDLMRDEFQEAHEKRLLPWSYFFTYTNTLFTRRRLGQQYIRELLNSPVTHEDEWNINLARLYRGSKIAAEVGSKFVVAIFPLFYDLTEDYPFQPLHDLVRTHCEKNDVPVLDLLKAYKGESHMDLWAHPTDHHPNKKAHKIAAGAIADYIVNEPNFLPR